MHQYYNDNKMEENWINSTVEKEGYNSRILFLAPVKVMKQHTEKRGCGGRGKLFCDPSLAVLLAFALKVCAVALGLTPLRPPGTPAPCSITHGHHCGSRTPLSPGIKAAFTAQAPGELGKESFEGHRVWDTASVPLTPPPARVPMHFPLCFQYHRTNRHPCFQSIFF